MAYKNNIRFRISLQRRVYLFIFALVLSLLKDVQLSRATKTKVLLDATLVAVVECVKVF